MSKLINLTELNSDNFFEMLKDSSITVYENIKGSKIFFKFENNEIILKSGSIKNNKITKVDLAIQKYYNTVYEYLENLDYRIKKLCDNDNWFCCEYFPDNQPSYIKYDRLPKNNLILTSIIKNDKSIFNLEEIKEFSDVLEIECLPVLYNGHLSDKQLELLKYFLHTKKEDIEFIFGDSNTNFSKFFYDMLLPNTESSFLMDNKFEENIDKIIIKINDSDIALSILNPLYNKTETNDDSYVDTYTILLCDFIEYLQTIDIDRRYISGDNSDDIYLTFISKLFNEYLDKKEDRILNFDFIIPPFFNKEKFNININLIENDKTKYYIKKSSKLAYLFKIILMSFKTKKETPIGVFNKKTIDILNSYVDDISSIIDRALRIESENDLYKNKLLDFGTFFSIKYPKDAEDKVYPDLYKNLEDEVFSMDKKKGYRKKK